MISDKLKDGKSIICGSNYDGGKHIGFYVVLSDGKYISKTADEFLTKEQIKCVELVVSVLVNSFVSSENTSLK